MSNTLFGLSKDIQQSKAELLLSTSKDFAFLGRQAAENTAAVQLEALKNKASIEKQMGMQFADLSTKILTSESNIKDLLEKTENDRLRDELRSNENKTLYFELKDRHHGHHGGHHGGHRRRHH